VNIGRRHKALHRGQYPNRKHDMNERGASEMKDASDISEKIINIDNASSLNDC
jgi:hypothetical protein